MHVGLKIWDRFGQVARYNGACREVRTTQRLKETSKDNMRTSVTQNRYINHYTLHEALHELYTLLVPGTSAPRSFRLLLPGFELGDVQVEAGNTVPTNTFCDA